MNKSLKRADDQRIEGLLADLFHPCSFEQTYVDCASHNSLMFLYNGLGLGGICCRGLINIRRTVTQPAFRLSFRANESSGTCSFSDVTVHTGPKGVEQRASASCQGQTISGVLRCVASSHNVYRLLLELSTDGEPLEGALLADGKWEGVYSIRDCREEAGCIQFAVSQDNPRNVSFSSAEEDWATTWRWSMPGSSIGLDSCDDGWQLNLGAYAIPNGSPIRLEFVLEVENRPRPKRLTWGNAPVIDTSYEQVEERARDRVLTLMKGLAGQDRTSYPRELRAAMVLARCEYKGVHGQWGDHAASFCMVTDWASTTFFWDAVFGALGLAEFASPFAEQAVQTLFAFQRDDGCVPTASYEYSPGSTFYPQLPLISWCLSRLMLRHDNRAFLKEMLPKARGVFDWFMSTQDHDRDGLIEARFSGQIADNAPQYDRYARHIGAAQDGIWNVYLAPAASVAMNSAIYMEGQLLARLYRLVGDTENADIVEQLVAPIPELLVKHCWDEATGFFHDYDHHAGDFNRCRVLTSLLPLWARMPLPQRIKDILLNDNLLADERFFADPPFPYVARDDDQYDPEGYWRGRIWPHTTTWMLETLWQECRHEEADLAADRLMAIIERETGVRENYFSGQEPGGGSIDYQWSAATYLYLCNRRYREDVFGLFDLSLSRSSENRR